MTELAIITKAERDVFRAAGIAVAGAEGRMEDAMLSLRDPDGKYSRVTEPNYNLLRNDCKFAYYARKMEYCKNTASDSVLEKVKLWEADALAEVKGPLYAAFRKAWSRAAERTGFPVYGKNAGNSNAKGDTKAPGEKAKPADKKVEPANKTEEAKEAKNAAVTTAAKLAKNVSDVAALDHLFRQTATTLRDVAIKKAKLTGVAQYAALAEEFYNKVMALEVPKD